MERQGTLQGKFYRPYEYLLALCRRLNQSFILFVKASSTVSA
jgi:hypothetical protein